MLASTINLTIFIMMIIIYLNELKNVSLFVFNFNYIKDLSKIIMEQKCNNIYCEAETDRYQIAKNSYKLLLPNDIFNSKTYTIMVFIISIMIYIYYYYQLFDNDESDKYYYFLMLHFILLAMLISMIILRYVPHDEAGYQNYFRDFDDPNNTFATFITSFKYFIWVSIFLIIPGIIYFIKKSALTSKMIPVLLIKGACYIFSIVLIFNLMNIVMTFRTNTKPILKTKNLSWSLQKTYTQLYEEYTGSELAELETEISAQYNIFIYIKDKMGKFTRETVKIKDKEITSTKDNPSTKEHIISYIINIFIAFDELAKITLKKLSIDESYKTSLINIINENNAKLLVDTACRKMNTNVSNVSLIYDKTVKIPYTYGTNDSNTVGENNTNGNENNTDYIYTADISYDSPNLFYEKYWDINDVSFWKQDYFVPTILFASRPNLYKILTMIIGFIICFFIIYIITSLITSEEIQYNSGLYILKPLIMFVILMIFILFFISFNTWFNKYVVYMCLDSSYKRSLNKLNNIVIPYIRMYDNKIIKGNKTYIRHYIIANVFYSILSGNIKLNEGASVSSSAAPEAAAQTPLTPPFIAKTRISNVISTYNEATKANKELSLLLINLNPTTFNDSKQAIIVGQIINSAKIAFGSANTSSAIALTAIAEQYEDISGYIINLDLKIKDINILILNITDTDIQNNFYSIQVLVNEAVLIANKASPIGGSSDIAAILNIIKTAIKSVNDLNTELKAVKPQGSKSSSTNIQKKDTLKTYGEAAKTAVNNAKNIIDKTYNLQKDAQSSAYNYRVALYNAVNQIIIGRDKNGNIIRDYLGSTPTLLLDAVNGVRINNELIKSQLEIESEKSNIAQVKSIIKTAYSLTNEAKNLSDIALRDATLANEAVLKETDKYDVIHSSLEPINDQEEENTKYYDIQRIKTGRLKFANMNNSILSNDNEFREYYKALYKNIYNETHDEARANKLYRVFRDIFTNPSAAIRDDAKIEDYFKTNIITNNPDTGTVSKIYFIIKKCIELFDEEKFNNNLIYYNNPDNKQKGIDINSYNKFKFYKYGDNVIPYKFILKLNTKSEYDDFVKDIITTANTTLNNIITVDFGIPAPSAGQTQDITPILEDNSEEDLLSQASDIEKKQDKNLIKIIAKYLLILGHINYNRIEYNDASSDPEKKKDIYERKSYYLYKLISNILYNDTYDINDTFQITTAPDLVIKNSKYYNLTYIYNYLETKYVVISPNINKNYLINIIKSINNKINDDDKTLNSEVKNARYLFRDKIDNKNNPEEYDNEEDILNIANSISTISFGATYIFNIVLMTVYFYIISLNVKKSF
jgi:hypothetical protein